MIHKDLNDYYTDLEKKNCEFVKCYVFFVIALIIAAFVLTILEWIGR
jgi:hypothetical protein